MSEDITIPRVEYDELIRRSELLNCLEEAGVDNWEGHHEAVKLYNERMGIDDE